MLGDSEGRSTGKEESTGHSQADRHSHFCLGEGPASAGRGGICGQGRCASLSASLGHRAARFVPWGTLRSGSSPLILGNFELLI